MAEDFLDLIPVDTGIGESAGEVMSGSVKDQIGHLGHRGEPIDLLVIHIRFTIFNKIDFTNSGTCFQLDIE